MSAERFTLDTILLVYAVDRTAGWKHELSMEIVDRAVECDCTLTIQALAEFFAAVTRKGLVPKAEAAAQVEDWLELFPTTAADDVALTFALASTKTGRFGFWDALLLATAHVAGCSVVLTEDLHDGAALEGIVVRHPFRAKQLLQPVRDLLAQ